MNLPVQSIPAPPASLPARAVAALVDTILNGVAAWCLLLGLTTLWPGLVEASGLVAIAVSVTFQDLAVRAVAGTAWEPLLVPASLGVGGVLCVVHWSSIASRGASIGKSLVGLRMVGRDNKPVGFFQGVVLRQWVWMGVLLGIPFMVQVVGFGTVGSVLAGLGALVQLFNAVSVLEEHHKALHDVLAETQVVNATARPVLRAAVVLLGLGGALAAWVFAPSLKVRVDEVQGLATPSSALSSSSGGSPQPGASAATPAPTSRVAAAPSTSAPAVKVATPNAAVDAGVPAGAQPAGQGGQHEAATEPASPAPTPDDKTLVYKWVDARGDVHFTQGKSSIPPRFRRKAEARPDLSATVPRSTQAAAVAEDPVIHFKPGKHIPVDVLLNGKVTAHLWLDTGADKTVVRPALLEEAGVRLQDGIEARMSGVVARQARKVTVVQVQKVQLSGHTVENLLVAAYDMESAVDGLLGQDFLAHFNVNIDAARGEVRLTPRVSP